ncbi:ABC transporter substrate-binding protein [Burkholderia ubonensis]|uniref:ABC transporter substrate-binding protein n=1 Tax=Burkholderia ubonensis TaxID=101571 RepID=UPI00210E56F2|nr:ABC transporter substrate-binding protein [Burkholderia ubonensis]
MLFYASMDARAGLMVKQIKNLGMKTKILSMDGVMSNLFIKLAGGAAEGNMASSIGLPQNKLAGFLKFSKKFSATYDAMQSHSPYSRDAFMALVVAMNKANSTDQEKFSPQIREVRSKGVTGPIQFDKNGDLLNGAIAIYRVQNGKWVAVSSSCVRRAPTVTAVSHSLVAF